MKIKFIYSILGFLALVLLIQYQNCGSSSSGGSGLNLGGSTNPSSVPTNQGIVTLLPIQSVTASGSLAGFPASNAIDADTSSIWNSGGVAPQWIQIDLGSVRNVTSINLLVIQNPGGASVHQILGGLTQNAMTTLATVSQVTTEGQTLPVNFNANVRYIQITTTQSTSWIAWSDIKVFGF